MKILSLISILSFSCAVAIGQNLIGYNSRQIQKYMKENRKEMNIEKVINNKYKYLKYSDNTDTETLLFFLSPDSVCLSVRMVCDVGIKAEKIKEFNAIYKKKGEKLWIDERNGKKYIIEFSDEDWSSIFTIKTGK
jgi:hypothetical protein